MARTFRPIVITGALLAISIGCAVPNEVRNGTQPKVSTTEPHPALENSAKAKPRKILAHGATLFPDDGLTSWISYGDQVSVVEVESEEEIPPNADVLEHGEGYIGRKVVLRVIRNLWVRDSFAPETGVVELLAFGWILQNYQRVLAGADITPRIEVGGRYIIPLVRLDDGWSPLTPHSVVPAVDSVIAEADIAENGLSSTARSMMGKSNDEIRRLLASVPKDPAVEHYRDLPPEQRVRAVLGVKPIDAPPRESLRINPRTQEAAAGPGSRALVKLF